MPLFPLKYIWYNVYIWSWKLKCLFFFILFLYYFSCVGNLKRATNCYHYQNAKHTLLYLFPIFAATAPNMAKSKIKFLQSTSIMETRISSILYTNARLHYCRSFSFIVYHFKFYWNLIVVCTLLLEQVFFQLHIAKCYLFVLDDDDDNIIVQRKCTPVICIGCEWMITSKIDVICVLIKGKTIMRLPLALLCTLDSIGLVRVIVSVGHLSKIKHVCTKFFSHNGIHIRILPIWIVIENMLTYSINVECKWSHLEGN